MSATTANRLRIGVVGLSADGGWAARSHAPTIRATERIELTGVAASTLERSKAAAERHNVPHAFSSAAELAADDRIDAIVIAVKVPEHEQLIAQTLPAGKPILCEWPLAVMSREVGQSGDWWLASVG